MVGAFPQGGGNRPFSEKNKNTSKKVDMGIGAGMMRRDIWDCR